MDQLRIRPTQSLRDTWTVAPPYELFFARLQIFLSPDELERVGFAYLCSKYGHKDQTRDDGTRYFDHPKAAAWIYIHELQGRDAEIIIYCLLHDLSEDAYLLSPYRIRVNFGENIALGVRALTKLKSKKESTDLYLVRVSEYGPRVIVAKLCDRLHNLRTLKSCSVEKQLVQIKETEEYHLAYLIPELRKHGGTWGAMADRLEKLIREAGAAIPNA